MNTTHWYRAQQIVETWRAYAHRLLVNLGDNEGAWLENRILGLLRAHPEGASVRETYRTLRALRKAAIDALRALENDRTLVRVDTPNKPGPKSETYRLVQH